MGGMTAQASETAPSFHPDGTGEPAEFNFNTAEADTTENNTYPSELKEQTDSLEDNGNIPTDSPAGTENQGLNIEALKNMLSPSQKAMFETYSSLLNGNTAV